MLKSQKLFNPFLLFLAVASIGVACKDEEVTPTITPTSPQVAVNNWVYDVMKDYYLWTDQMPANPNKNQEPEAFFNSLKSSEDRFSFIVDDYQGLMNSLEGVNYDAGYEFSLARASENSSEIWAFVTYIKPNSPAEEQGLKRGDIITHINNTQLTDSNYQTLLSQLSSTHSVRYNRYNPATEQVEAQAAVSLIPVVIAENPHFMDTVYTTATGQKVGYYVYNFFSPGIDNSTEYDIQMEQIITNFKTQGISELILDLRYNRGGRVSSATNLASLIGKNVNSTKDFYQYRYNNAVQNYFMSQPNPDENLKGKFLDKSVNIGNDLASGTVYILADRGTASASELIINGLKPYMNVVLIGGKTVGKNVGSVPFEDKENPDNKYGILPIIFEISNSLGSSAYADGFMPNFPVYDLSLNMKPLGDVNEALLAQALSIIEGNSGSRISGDTPAARSRQFSPIGSSLERKAWSERIIFDNIQIEEENPFQ